MIEVQNLSKVFFLNFNQYSLIKIEISHLDSGTPIPDYVDNRHGMYPAPFGRNAKTNVITKVRQKFKFLGKFMAKALMDSRMVRFRLTKTMLFYHSYFRSIFNSASFSTNGF